MPFTLCHPAALAAIPSKLRTRLPLAALAIGTMSPDFEYLFRLEPRPTISHSLPGLILFCLPCGLVVWTAWEYIVRTPTRELLALRQDRPRHAATGRTFVAAAAAILLGGLTHLGWDAFTHAGRLGAELFPALEHEAWRIGTYSLRWFGVLQHLSTVGGAVVIGVWLMREHRCSGIEWTQRSTLLVLTLLAVSAAAGVFNALGPEVLGRPGNPGRVALLARFTIGGMLGAALGLFVHSLVRRLNGSVKVT